PVDRLDSRAERRSTPQRRLGAVVAHRVEPALGVEALAQVAVGADDSLAVVERARDHVAPGRLDYRRAAAPEDLLVRELEREVVREGLARDVLGDRHDEGPRLDRDV